MTCILAAFICLLQSQAGLPRSYLVGKAVKRAVNSCLLQHALSNGERVLAFRVAWRPDGELLDAAWRTVVERRRLCDAIVARERDIQFFVSSITGVYTRRSDGAAPERVFPAINYWVSVDGSVGWQADTHLTNRIASEVRRSAGLEASEVKPISVRHRRPSSAAGCTLEPALLVVFKDHNCRFIHNRIDDSLQHLGLAGDSALRNAVKMVVVNRQRYAQYLLDTRRIFASVGLHVAVEVADDGRDVTDAATPLVWMTKA